MIITHALVCKYYFYYSHNSHSILLAHFSLILCIVNDMYSYSHSNFNYISYSFSKIFQAIAIYSYVYTDNHLLTVKAIFMGINIVWAGLIYFMATSLFL